MTQKTDGRELLAWVFAALCATAVALSPAACTMNRQHVIAEAVRGGADPISMKCAMEFDAQHSPMCVAQAMRSK